MTGEGNGGWNPSENSGKMYSCDPNRFIIFSFLKLTEETLDPFSGLPEDSYLRLLRRVRKTLFEHCLQQFIDRHDFIVCS
jgi:hypothetical protein